jgi:hypothetical protein
MLRAEPPEGWGATQVSPPSLGGGSGATLTQWAAHRSPAGDERLLIGCVQTPIPGWVEEMRGAVEARSSALAAASAARLGGADLTTHSRTFLGWDGRSVVTCFAACGGRGPERACDRNVDEAQLVGGTAAPPPGLALALVTSGVHHPQATVGGAGLFFLCAGAVAVAARRKPRSRI